MFVDVREPHTNKLLFRYDPIRNLIEIQRRGVLTTIDLQNIKERLHITEPKIRNEEQTVVSL